MYAFNLRRLDKQGSIHRYDVDFDCCLLSTFDFDFQLNKWYDLRIELFENQINVFIDDDLKTYVLDDDNYLTYGKVTFMLLSFSPGQIVWIDDVNVVELLPISR